MLHLNAAFHLPIGETRADLALVDQLVVGVVAPAKPITDGFDAAGVGAPLAPGGNLVLRHIDARALLDGVFTGDAVEAGEVLIVDTDVTVSAHERAADRPAFALNKGVRLHTVRRVVVVGAA